MVTQITLPKQPILKSAAGAGAFLIQSLFPLQTEIYLSWCSPFATIFSRLRDVMVSHTLKVIYFPIPKSACTLFATTLALHDESTRDYDPVKEGIHHYRFRTRKLALEDMSYLCRDDYFKFTIIRDPYTRLLSAYLDKIVKPYKIAAERAAKSKTLNPLYGHSLDELSFDSLIHFLARVPDYAIEKHWRPQHTFFRNVSLDYIGCFEHMNDACAVMLNRYGINVTRDVAPLVFSPKRTGYTDAVDTTNTGELSGLSPEQLIELSEFPGVDAFYNPELRAMVERRFSRDLALYRRISNSLCGVTGITE